MAAKKREPFYYSAVFERIQYAYKRQLKGSAKFELNTETYENDGMVWYQAYVRIDGGVVKCSVGSWESPEDALLDLARLVDADIGKRLEFAT
jgi:hypothetical protein